MKKSIHLHEESIYLLQELIKLNKEGKIEVRPGQILECIKVLENVQVRNLMESLQKYNYIKIIRATLSDKKSKNLPFNNPWHTLENLRNDMVWGNIPDYLDDSLKEIWHKVQGFNLYEGLLENIRWRIMIFILVVFGKDGLKQICEYIPVLFSEPVRIKLIDGLPTIQIRERINFSEFKKWLDDNKDYIQEVFDRFHWIKKNRPREKLLRDLEILLFRQNGNKILSISKQFKISDEATKKALDAIGRSIS